MGDFLTMKIIQFYDSENDFRKFYAILKQVMCPHCKLIGKLILWGYLRGNAEDHPNKRLYWNYVGIFNQISG